MFLVAGKPRSGRTHGTGLEVGRSSVSTLTRRLADIAVYSLPDPTDKEIAMREQDASRTSLRRLAALLLAAAIGAASSRLAAQEPRVFRADAWRVAAMSFSPDGKTLALTVIGMRTGEHVQMMDARTGEITLDELLSDSPRFGVLAASCVEFSPDGTVLAVLAQSPAQSFVLLYDAENKGQMARIAVDDGTAAKDPQATYAGRSAHVVFSRDGTLVAAGAVGDRVGIWDTQGNLQATLSGHTGGVVGVAFLPAGADSSPGSHPLCLTADGAGTLRLWTVQGRKRGEWNVASHFAFPEREKNPQKPPRGKKHALPPSRALDRVAVAPDGKTALLGASATEANLLLWDIPSHTMRCALGNGCANGIHSLVFSSDAKMVLCSNNRSTDLWNVETKKLLASKAAQFGGMSHPHDCVAISPDGKTLALAGWFDDAQPTTGKRPSAFEEMFDPSKRPAGKNAQRTKKTADKHDSGTFYRGEETIQVWNVADFVSKYQEGKGDHPGMAPLW
jgi:WD40 repeat protein